MDRNRFWGLCPAKVVEKIMHVSCEHGCFLSNMCQFVAFADGVSREPQWPVTAIPALM